MPKDKAQGVIVCLRFRPLNRKEIDEFGDGIAVDFNKDIKGNIVTTALNDNVVKEMKISKKAAKFSFDRIFTWKHTQEHVYERTASPMVKDVFKGFNCTIFAYGQTGTGKSYSMMGILGTENEGIIPRIVEQIFGTIETEISKEEPETDFEVQVSYVEIYMEKVKDLLNPKNQNGNLKIRENPKNGIYIQGVTEQWVSNADEVYRVMDIGVGNRAIASTKMNSESSRSHSVFSMKVAQISKRTGSKKVSKVFLVDLAGSEKVRKTEAKGQTLKEATMINRSLSALGNVINALTENKPHIPYRNSKLTRLLSDSLGGNAKTCLILTASPSLYNSEETLNTMRFGKRAKMIKNKPKINAERTVEEYKELLEAAEKKIRHQQTIIDTLRGGGTVEGMSESSEKGEGEARMAEMKSLTDKVQEYLEIKEALETEMQELKEQVEDSNLILKEAEEGDRKGKEEVKMLKEKMATMQLEMAEELRRDRELNRKTMEIKVQTLESEKEELKRMLEEQEETLKEKIKTFMPSFEKIKEETKDCETPEEKRIKTLELENTLLVEDLARKCQEYVTLSCENDEMKSKQKLYETVGPGGVLSKENAKLKLQLEKMKNESQNHLKLAAARSEQITIIERALEKAISESRLYKQGMEESEARFNALMQGNMAAPRMGIGLGRRRNRVIPNMKRRVARNTIFDTGSSFVRGHEREHSQGGMTDVDGADDYRTIGDDNKTDVGNVNATPSLRRGTILPGGLDSGTEFDDSDSGTIGGGSVASSTSRNPSLRQQFPNSRKSKAMRRASTNNTLSDEFSGGSTPRSSELSWQPFSPANPAPAKVPLAPPSPRSGNPLNTQTSSSSFKAVNSPPSARRPKAKDMGVGVGVGVDSVQVQPRLQLKERRWSSSASNGEVKMGYPRSRSSISGYKNSVSSLTDRGDGMTEGELDDDLDDLDDDLSSRNSAPPADSGGGANMLSAGGILNPFFRMAYAGRALNPYGGPLNGGENPSSNS